jgi:hypothetical protein
VATKKFILILIVVFLFICIFYYVIK